MTPTPALPVRHLSITIHRRVDEVAAFLADPLNFRRWAAGMGDSLRPGDGGDWLCDAPQGLVRVRFSPPNGFGIADHWVTLPNGDQISIPLRAIANGDATEVVFTLFRQLDMDDEAFAADAEMVMRDLEALRALLEAESASHRA